MCTKCAKGAGGVSILRVFFKRAKGPAAGHHTAEELHTTRRRGSVLRAFFQSAKAAASDAKQAEELAPNAVGGESVLRVFFRRGVLAIFLPAILWGQTQSEMKEVLARLQRLEEQNRTLVSELHSLREELKAERAGKAEAPAAEEPLEERVSVNEKRVEEQSQTKVESEHRFPVQLTGMLLFNAFLNGRLNGNAEYPVAASLTEGSASGGATVRQSVIGLKFQGPRLPGGGEVTGSLFMDFFAGAGDSLNQLFRVRVASLDLGWKRTTVSFAQDKPILAPREPTSLAQVGLSPLTGAGNLWLWQPQVRVEQRFDFGERDGFRAQLGVYQTGDDYAGVTSKYGGASGEVRPALQGRFEYRHQFGSDRALEIAPGFSVSSSHVAGQSVPSRIASVDWLIRPLANVDFTGMFFGGENTGVLGGLRQGITVGPDYVARAVRAYGGWAQVTWRATPRLSFNVYGGQEDDRRSDLLVNGIGKNQTYAANFIYRLGPNLLGSFEASQSRTYYIGSGTRLNPHYDLALAYLF